MKAHSPHRVLYITIMILGAAPPAIAQDIPDGGPDGSAEDADVAMVSEHCLPDAVGCSTADIDWLYRDALFEEVDLDTGWVPAGSPIQLRFGIAIGGSTEIAMGGTVVGSWPPAIALALPGRPGTGRLEINYGFEIIAQLRFDVEVAGVRYDWEGDIPIPFIPEDLRLAGEREFDPFALPGADLRPITVFDNTDRVRVLWIDALSAIIPIPGVGGGFLIAVQAELETAYQTERIEVENALPIVGEGEHTRLDPPPETDPDAEGGYGSAAEVTAHPEGTLAYDGRILIIPELYLDVVGTRFDFPLAEIPVNLLDLESEVIFDDETVDIPIPDVDVQPSRITFGWGFIDSVIAQRLVFVNNGDAPLSVEAVTSDGPFSIEPSSFTIEPHRTERVQARFRPSEEGTVSGMFEVVTNDPDEPSVIVLMEGEGRFRPMPEPSPSDADVEADGGLTDDADVDGEPSPGHSGCDCEVSGGTHGRGYTALFLWGLGSLIFWTRRLSRDRR